MVLRGARIRLWFAVPVVLVISIDHLVDLLVGSLRVVHIPYILMKPLRFHNLRFNDNVLNAASLLHCSVAKFEEHFAGVFGLWGGDL